MPESNFTLAEKRSLFLKHEAGSLTDIQQKAYDRLIASGELSNKLTGELAYGEGDTPEGRKAVIDFHRSLHDIRQPKRLQDLKENAPEIVGGLLTLGEGGVASRMIRGAAGAFGTETAIRGAELSDDPTKDISDIWDVLKDASITGAQVASGEGVSTGIAKGVGKLFGATKLIPGSEALVRRFVKRVTSRGGTINPALVTDNKYIDLFNNIVEGAMFAGGRLERKTREAAQIVQDDAGQFAQELVGRVGREEVGAALQVMLDNKVDVFRGIAQAKFFHVDQALGGSVKVNMTELKRVAEVINDEIDQGLRDPKLTSVINDVMSKPDEVSFSEAHKLWSDLNDLSDTRLAVPTKSSVGAGRLEVVLDGSMQKAAHSGILKKGAASRIRNYKFYQEARQFRDWGKDNFDNAVVQRILHSDPDAALPILLKDQSPTRIRRLRNLITNDVETGMPTELGQRTWQRVQGQWMQELMTKSLMEDNVTVSGKKLVKALQDMGDETLSELIPDKATRLRWIDFGRQLELAQRDPTTSKIGRVWIQLSTAGAIGGITYGFTGDPVGSLAPASVVVIGPYLLGRLLTSKVGYKWLVTGFKAPPGSKEFTKAMSQLGALKAREAIVGERDRLNSEIRTNPSELQ